MTDREQFEAAALGAVSDVASPRSSRTRGPSRLVPAYTTGAANAVNAPGYARAIIRGGPAAVEALLNGPLAAHGG